MKLQTEDRHNKQVTVSRDTVILHASPINTKIRLHLKSMHIDKLAA